MSKYRNLLYIHYKKFHLKLTLMFNLSLKFQLSLK